MMYVKYLPFVDGYNGKLEYIRSTCLPPVVHRGALAWICWNLLTLMVCVPDFVCLAMYGDSPDLLLGL